MLKPKISFCNNLKTQNIKYELQVPIKDSIKRIHLSFFLSSEKYWRKCVGVCISECTSIGAQNDPRTFHTLINLTWTLHQISCPFRSVKLIVKYIYLSLFFRTQMSWQRRKIEEQQSAHQSWRVDTISIVCNECMRW